MPLKVVRPTTPTHGEGATPVFNSVLRKETAQFGGEHLATAITMGPEKHTDSFYKDGKQQQFSFRMERVECTVPKPAPIDVQASSVTSTLTSDHQTKESP